MDKGCHTDAVFAGEPPHTHHPFTVERTDAFFDLGAITESFHHPERRRGFIDMTEHAPEEFRLGNSIVPRLRQGDEFAELDRGWQLGRALGARCDDFLDQTLQ